MRKPHTSRALVYLLIFLFHSSASSQELATTNTKIQRSFGTNINTELFTAIRSGSERAVDSLLQRGADANAWQDDYSALMTATLCGSLRQMQMLILRGANINIKNSDSLTALWYAVPNQEKTTLLIDHGADPRIKSDDGYSVLVKLANVPGTENLCRLLIDHGADPKNSGRDNFLIYNAASSCDTALLGYLLGLGLSPNDSARNGDYPINAAINYRCFPTIKMLIDHGADVNALAIGYSFVGVNGISPLMYAAISGDSLSVSYLIDHGAKINAKSAIGYTPLMYLQLAQFDYPSMTQTMLDHGADPSIKTPDGTDALMLAIKKGNTLSVALIKKKLIK